MLAVLWRAADDNPDWVRKNLRADGRPRAGRALELRLAHESLDGPRVCGHELRIATDAKCQIGGGGVVIPCVDADAPTVRYALKVARPSLFSTTDKANAEFAKAKNEYLTHLPLSHENIAKMYAYSEVRVRLQGSAQTLHLPCTLIEWVDGALPLHEHILTRVNEALDVPDLLAQTCRALGQLHRFRKVHWDIKGDNVLVDRRGVVKVMDLGNARDLLDADSRYEAADIAESTDLNLPVELQQRLRKTKDLLEKRGERISRNRGPCELRKGELAWDRPWLDLYMLAREINRSLGLDQATLDLDAGHSIDGSQSSDDLGSEVAMLRERLLEDEQGEYVGRYIGRVIDRLLRVSDPTATPFYNSADDVVQALDRLRPEYGEATDIPELQPIPQHVLRIPPVENVPWTERVKHLMNSPPVSRLKDHRQLATVHHVFPGAEHSRWEHAAGTFNAVLQYVRALYADRSSVFFRLDTSKLDVTALMLASLLHDLGHPAYGHQLEESPIISTNLHHEQHVLSVLRACLDLDRIDSPTTNATAAADAAAIRPILQSHWCSDDMPLSALIERAIEILEADASSDAETGTSPRTIHTQLLGSLIVGELDADKMDYLLRDAHHCGVEYSNGIDRRRLEQSLTGIAKPTGDLGQMTGMLAVTEKGIVPLESLLIARYQMFRVVYWHRTVRAMTVMLQEAVERYVAPSDAHSGDGERLERLIAIFRERSDTDALRWLREQLPVGLRYLCDGVDGDRQQIFKLVLELYGDEELGEGGEYWQPPFPTQDHVAYGRLVALWSAAQGGVPGLDAMRRRRDIRQALAHSMSKALGDRTGHLVDTNDVLIDVPVAGKDQIRNLFVARDRPNGRETVPLEAVTPLARAVAKAFDRSVRPVRVFLKPTRLAALVPSTVDELELTRLLKSNLRGVVDAVDAQLQIPLGLDGDAPKAVVTRRARRSGSSRPTRI